MAAVSKRGRGRKALNAVTESEVNISAAVVTEIPAEQSKETVKAALSPSKKTKNAKSKNKAETTQETALSPAFADEMERLQAQLQELQMEKTRTEEMLREKDEILRKKDEEQGKLQAELKKLQRVKEFKPTVNFPLVKSLVEKEQEEKGKKKKTKSTLKKPCPAYVLWLKDQWTRIKKENPEADFKEISNTLGAKWKGLSAEDKKPYEEQYQQDKEAYLQVVGKEKRETEAMKLLEDDQMQKTAMELLEQYMKFKQDADDMEKKKSRKEKDPLKPKQPMSAFFIFSNERRAALVAENKSVVEVAKIAGEEWKNMSEKKKAPYEKIAMKQREEYKQQMEIYTQKKLEETSALEKEEEEQKKILKQEALQLLKKKEKTENIIKKTKDQKKKQKDENADPNKPKKPASSFILFSKETRKQLHEERPDMPNSTMNALISVKWKELSDEEKQKWNEEAAKNMAEYRKELEEYNKSKPSSSN